MIKLNIEIKPHTNLEEIIDKAEKDFVPLGIIVHEPWFENLTDKELQEQRDYFKKIVCGL